MYASFLDELSAFLDSSAVQCNADMSQYTSFKAGGRADILLHISEAQTLQRTVCLLKKHALKYMVIGNGTNLLVKDTGYGGVLIRFFHGSFAPVVSGTTLHAHAGMLLSALSQSAAEQGLSGLEFLSGIPGTVGGAVYMNAGAYGGEIKDVLTQVHALTADGTMTILPADQLEFAYRSSAFHHNGAVILNADFHATYAPPASIYAKMSSINAKRREKQPLEYPSAGSTFKRPVGYYAGQLIEQCGLKGRGVGGAKVSEKHAGFIINYNHATAQDIIDTIDMVRRTVQDAFGITLETEVQILGT